MQTYETYKNSGIDWLGKIPSHWEVYRLGVIGVFSSSGIDKLSKPNEPIVKIVNYTDIYKNSNRILDSKLSYMEVTTPEINRRKNLINKGDLIFIPSSETFHDLGLSALVNEQIENLSFSYHVLRFQFRRKLNHGFKKYFTNNQFVLDQFSSRGTGSIRKTLNRNDFRNIIVTLPPISEQEAIAAFLDEKCGKIDELVSVKEQQIALLKERRQVVIHEAVTKGIQPNVEMKDSGIDWIGEIPSHWEVKRLKNLIKNLEGGVSVNASESESALPNDIGVLKTSCVYNYRFESTENKKVLPNEISRVSCQVRNGAIIISRMNAPELVGASGLVIGDFPNLYLPDRLWQTVYNTSINFSNVWLSKILVSNGFRNYMTTFANGSSPSMKNISKGDFLNIFIPFPPISEQEAIVAYLEEQMGKIDQAIALKTEQIEKLKAYKQSLINEVVTGKVKVA